MKEQREVHVQCKVCKGSGRAAGKTKPPCPKCKGSGKVVIIMQEIG